MQQLSFSWITYCILTSNWNKYLMLIVQTQQIDRNTGRIWLIELIWSMAWYILKNSTWIRLNWPYHAFCVPIMNKYNLISKCRKFVDCLLFIQGLIHTTKTDSQHIYEVNVLIHTKKRHLLNNLVRFGVQKFKHHICIDTKKSCFSSLRSWSFSKNS